MTEETSSKPPPKLSHQIFIYLLNINKKQRNILLIVSIINVLGTTLTTSNNFV